MISWQGPHTNPDEVDAAMKAMLEAKQRELEREEAEERKANEKK